MKDLLTIEKFPLPTVATCNEIKAAKLNELSEMSLSVYKNYALFEVEANVYISAARYPPSTTLLPKSHFSSNFFLNLALTFLT